MLKNKQRFIGLFLALAFLFPMLPSIPALAAEAQNDPKAYIIVMEDGVATQAVEQEINGDTLADNEILAENNMLSAELTNKEAKALEKQDGVLFVEEDFEIKGHSIATSTSSDEEISEEEKPEANAEQNPEWRCVKCDREYKYDTTHPSAQ